MEGSEASIPAAGMLSSALELYRAGYEAKQQLGVPCSSLHRLEPSAASLGGTVGTHTDRTLMCTITNPWAEQKSQNDHREQDKQQYHAQAHLVTAGTPRVRPYTHNKANKRPTELKMKDKTPATSQIQCQEDDSSMKELQK